MAHTDVAAKPPPAGPEIDPFGAMLARAELEKASDQRATTAASRSADRMSDIDLARRLAFMLAKIAEKVGIDPDPYGWDLEGLAREVVQAAQGGKLPASDYRAAFMVWKIFQRHAPRQVTESPSGGEALTF